MDAWGSLLALVGSQHGVVSVRQLRELGIEPKTFGRRATREGWTHHGNGIWSPPGIELTEAGRLNAAVLAAGPHAAVTGAWALRLHGLDVTAPAPIRLVTPMTRHTARHLDPAAIRVISSRTLLEGDLTLVRRVPATAIERSFVDLVLPPTPPLETVRDLLITAFQARGTTAPKIRDRVDRSRHFAGRPLLMRALDEIDARGADSPLTLRVVLRLIQEGFRPDPHPVAVVTPNRTLHPDVTFGAHRVCLECDGMRWHSRQEDLAIDARKDRSYLLAGWTNLRVGWWELTRGWPGLVRDLRQVLARPLPM